MSRSKLGIGSSLMRLSLESGLRCKWRKVRITKMLKWCSRSSRARKLSKTEMFTLRCESLVRLTAPKSHVLLSAGWAHNNPICKRAHRRRSRPKCLYHPRTLKCPWRRSQLLLKLLSLSQRNIRRVIHQRNLHPRRTQNRKARMWQSWWILAVTHSKIIPVIANSLILRPQR